MPQILSESQNDGCQSDNDCLDIANSQCVNQMCVCKDNYREEDGSCLPSNPFIFIAVKAIITADFIYIW